MNKRNVIFAVLMIVVFASCKKDKTDPTPSKVDTKDFLVNGNPAGGNYNFFSFENAAEVTQVDSASTKWDFAIRFETFIVNSNASGPGNAGVQIFNQPF
ncbi:MAG: HmuY family protein, partial [Chitinophagaceae bacterium]|nr:HmuY family protein [Chitinophagaceae bacterium]